MAETLYLVTSGAPTTETETLPHLIQLLTAEGWNITVVSTPTGARFHDLEAVERLTGEPARIEFRHPGKGKTLPPPTAILACPWSFNSTNRTVLGLADTFAVALLCEMIGRRTPTVIVPKAGQALAQHPAFDRSLRALTEISQVNVLYSPQRKLPSWREVADALSEAVSGR
ncbi:flavoprotein [Nocardiopsis sp. LOL_012]|uniref:flavoprotein n=1 Tax=Nocardiopsis sp. LOL_012 TaxID=3345409 RepID=UPI003A8456AD